MSEKLPLLLVSSNPYYVSAAEKGFSDSNFSLSVVRSFSSATESIKSPYAFALFFDRIAYSNDDGTPTAFLGWNLAERCSSYLLPWGVIIETGVPLTSSRFRFSHYKGGIYVSTTFSSNSTLSVYNSPPVLPDFWERMRNYLEEHFYELVKPLFNAKKDYYEQHRTPLKFVPSSLQEIVDRLFHYFNPVFKNRNFQKI